MSTIKATNIQNASSATTNIALDTSGNATVAGTLAMGSSFLRNRLINGGMQVWQRGTTGFTSGYAADRWFLNGANVASQSTDVPAGYSFSHAFSNSSATVAGIAQRIESVNTKDLAGATVTVSFWYKRTGAAGNLQVNLDYPTVVDNYTSTGSTGATVVSASPSTSWTYYTVTFTSLNASVVNGLQIYIVSVNGSAASIGGLVTGVQLEQGSIATPFERRSYGQELMLCQRYLPAFNSNGSTVTPIGIESDISTTQATCVLPLKVTARVIPSGLTASSGSAITLHHSGANIATTGISFAAAGIDAAYIILTVASGLTAGQSGYIYLNSATAQLLFTGCEL